MQDSSLADVADILDDYATIVGESDEPEALQQQQQVRALCAQLRGEPVPPTSTSTTTTTTTSALSPNSHEPSSVTDGQAASSEPE